jgi:large subunit ribosomal protein L25
MAGERTKLVVAQRDRLGSAESRRMRKEGLVPGVLYGSGEPVAICIAERELRRALTGASGLHSILDVEIDGKGETHASILKEYQVDPVRGGVTHVDLQEVRLDQTIQASVSVELHGGEDAPGVREGGVLSQPLREVTVEALPLEMPEHIDLDVAGMEIGGTLRISDLTAPEGSTLLDDPEMVVATVTAPTKVVEPEPTEEELAAMEAEEGEEGEAEEGAEGEAAEGAAEPEGESSGGEDSAEG